VGNTSLSRSRRRISTPRLPASAPPAPAFGDTYHDAANRRGPGIESGARGPGETVYLLDPNAHLVEIRRY
jgi:hypothetical protein